MKACSLGAAALALLLPTIGSLSPSNARAESAPAPGERSVEVAASDRYDKGRVHRFALGGGYRDLWTAEIELPVLDLRVLGGGVTPTKRFGGLQTAVLGFRGADGRSYTFRGTDKDPSAVLDPMLRDTIVRTIVQDQMAAQHPGGPAVAGVLSQAAGVLTIRERMVVMPDDPVLGAFREEFAGMVGTVYEYPLPAADGRAGFHDASEILDHEALYAKLAAGRTYEVDVEAFLRARLFDIALGDFDRHRKQWRWALLPGSDEYQPIPEDRDMAFVRYDGFGPRIGALYVPILQRYGPEYPRMKGLTLHGWEQDRWLLPALEWPVWEAVTKDLQARVTDEVIDRAIAALPPEYVALDGERLRADLRGRRDRWLEGARAYYEHLAREVDVQGSDASEHFEVTRDGDGGMRVVVRVAGRAEPVFERRFDSDDTSEVRLYLRGGDDRVVVTGGRKPIRLRVVTAEGGELIDDREGGGTRVYDSGGAARVEKGPRTRIDTRAYTRPPSDSGFVDVKDVPPRDWGFDVIPLPDFSYQPDVGVFLGGGAVYTKYGFRKHPWSQRHHVSAGYATEALQPRGEYKGRFRFENSRLMAGLDLEASGIEILRFYGFGNDTDDDRSDAFFRVRNRQFRAAPSVHMPWRDGMVRLGAGPWVSFSNTERGDRLIDMLQPYGFGKFGGIGATANLQLDTRTSLRESVESALALPFHENKAAGYPTRGFLVDLTGQISPPVWDVERTWGSVEASVAGFASLGEDARATLGLRIGGKHVFGKAPYFEAAYVGGSRFFSGNPTVRGFRAQRFAGESSVFGNLELRVKLARVKLLFPGDIGVLGFGDVGRVYVDGEDSDTWHPSGGGGIWFAPLVRTNAMSFTVAGSEEEALFYLRLGFHY